MSKRKGVTRRTWLAIGVSAVVIAAACLAAANLLLSDGAASAVGGAVLAETGSALEVRCLSPDLILHLNGFRGQVTVTNCFRDSEVVGSVGTVVQDGARLTFEVGGGADDISIVAPQKESFKFAVLGDSQGRNDMLAEMLDNSSDCEFVLHCGDLTPSASVTEFAALMDVLNGSEIPVMTTPGNHDAREGNLDEYMLRLGPASYSFTYSGVTFFIADSSDMNISEEELDQAREAFQGADVKVLMTHMPCYDPFTFNHTLDAGSCERVQQFALEEKLAAVFTGHVHGYYLLTVEGTDFMITGGAGGTLTEGVHHHVEVTVSNGTFSYEKVDLVTDVVPSELVSLVGKDGQIVNVTFGELAAMDPETAYSSYENLYGNIAGGGTYSGPTVASLVALVGGMAEGDILRVTSSDGYVQEFGYLNVFPDEDWALLQGSMVLAWSFDGSAMPDWEEGPRLAFLAPDGVYSNEDCELTSYPDQGWFDYPSAGARWSKNVAVIEVVAGP